MVYVLKIHIAYQLDHPGVTHGKSQMSNNWTQVLMAVKGKKIANEFIHWKELLYGRGKCRTLEFGEQEDLQFVSLSLLNSFQQVAEISCEWNLPAWN